MKRVALLAFSLVFLASLTACDMMGTKSNIGIVDSETILRTSKAGEKAKQHMEAFGLLVQQELELIQRDAAAATEENQQELEQRFQDLQRLYTQQQEQVVKVFEDGYAKAMENVRKNMNLSIIFEKREGYLAYAPECDVTMQVLAELNSLAMDLPLLPSFTKGAAPAVTPEGALVAPASDAATATPAAPAATNATAE